MLTRPTVAVVLMLAAGQLRAQAPDPDRILTEVVEIIEERHAYVRLQVPSLREMAATARARMGEAPTQAQINDQVQWLICRLGDGHASVGGWRGGLPGPYAPVLMGHLGAEPGSPVVAYRQDRTLLDPVHPFVTSIDGVPIEDWIATAGEYVTQGSPQLIRRRAVRRLRYIGWLREKRGAPASPRIIYGLRNADGTSEVTMFIPAVEQRAMFGRWPRSEDGARMLDGDIGYLRVSSMVRRSRWRDEHGPAWREICTKARGLVIDLRGNGGGVRDLVWEIVPWLLTEKTGPIVATVARLRLHDGVDDGDGATSVRRLFPETWAGWSEAERRAIKGVRETAAMQSVGAPDDWYGRWRYAVVSPRDDGLSIQGPVVVLIDDGVFSAADIFAGALDQVPGLVLMGQATGGGSARSREHAVRTAGFQIRLASMESHHPDGRLYDTNGIEPDVVIEMTANDYLDGTDDRMLERATELIRSMR